mmetsp:Transcript_43410/g.131223  ORF Transcript_43410/g.131223 Transcript_43410/m.131223 type:complete len:263 (-) Transcript_43410:321-1109(-)
MPLLLGVVRGVAAPPAAAGARRPEVVEDDVQGRGADQRRDVAAEARKCEAAMDDVNHPRRSPHAKGVDLFRRHLAKHLPHGLRILRHPRCSLNSQARYVCGQVGLAPRLGHEERVERPHGQSDAGCLGVIAKLLRVLTPRLVKVLPDDGVADALQHPPQQGVRRRLRVRLVAPFHAEEHLALGQLLEPQLDADLPQAAPALHVPAVRELPRGLEVRPVGGPVDGQALHLAHVRHHAHRLGRVRAEHARRRQEAPPQRISGVP